MDHLFYQNADEPFGNHGHPLDPADAQQVMDNYNRVGPVNAPNDENVNNNWDLPGYLQRGYSLMKNPVKGAIAYLMRRGAYAGLQGAWRWAWGIKDRPQSKLPAPKVGMSRGGYSITRHFCTF